jgi:pimeloyl-ACP methyl ester carboxylesterase
MDFEAFYADAPTEQREALRQFRATHPVKRTTANGVEWTYVVSGQGAPLLWLVGGLRVADAAYRSIPLLEDAFRIITPDYPSVSSMAELADGLAAVLDAEQIESAHVLAGSLGGMLAQVFARRHPDRVQKLILSTTTPPDPAAAAKYQQQVAFISGVDEPLVREGAKTQMFSTIAPPDNEATFWRAYLNELYATRLGKADIIATYECLLDYMQNHTFQPDDLAAWGERVLIINSDNDATFGTQVQDAMTQLYPQARVHTFIGAGHSPGSTQREAYFALVRAFLAE